MVGTWKPQQFTEAERKVLQGTWPMDLLEDPARQPRIVETAEAFINEVLTGEHLEDFVVLPRGVDLLGLSWDDSFPQDIRDCVRGSRCAVEFARKVLARPEMLEKYRADIEYIDPQRQQKDILKKDKHDLGKRIREALRMAEAGEVDADMLYVAEMRLKKEAPHPLGGENVKTVCLRDMKDVLGPLVSWTLYWDRYDEGFFAGGKRSGKGVHIDQVLWSNIGRHYQGYKLVAAWPKGEVSKQVALDFYDVLFSPPLKEAELQALRKAAKVVLLRPGDVYLFSGGIAHTVLCISEDMCLGAYESIVTLHPTHVDHFLHTSDKEGPYCLDSYSMSRGEFRDTKDDCLDQLEDAAEQFEAGGLGCALRRTPQPAEAPAMWSRMRERLVADKQFKESLKKHFATAVDLCAGDRYFRRHMIPRVLSAGKACGGLGGAVPLRPGQDGPRRKRRRITPPVQLVANAAVADCRATVAVLQAKAQEIAKDKSSSSYSSGSSYSSEQSAGGATV
eukprot:TRINITY_DN62582_c0_g1_i1.p1 TRINITY_DN62582_c0_g1~~TRINITY_DN62582_c0_g1_i1.p1  ORF type:complete len:514 (-),score=118.99 TRINITY_DN62582_c0_g1_i1:23-1534(-)